MAATTKAAAEPTTRVKRALNEFDLLDSIGIRMARFAEVAPPTQDDGPRID